VLCLGKNYGYAKFSKLEYAKAAMELLHGQNVCNMRLKVMHADPPKFNDSDSSSDRKRPRK
jgi:RNA recognition motif-containing protein